MHLHITFQGHQDGSSAWMISFRRPVTKHVSTPKQTWSVFCVPLTKSGYDDDDNDDDGEDDDDYADDDDVDDDDDDGDDDDDDDDDDDYDDDDVENL